MSILNIVMYGIYLEKRKIVKQYVTGKWGIVGLYGKLEKGEKYGKLEKWGKFGKYQIQFA